MNDLCKALVCALLCLPTVAFSQQTQQPNRLSPEAVKMLQDQEKQMLDSIANSNKHPGPKFNYSQCRADTQRWTVDPFDNKDERNMMQATALQVNGRFRSMPILTYHLMFPDLQGRIYEMAVCQTSDAEFEEKYGTYTLMGKLYLDEKLFRYVNFIQKHNLYDQFIKEDSQEYK